MGTRRVRLALLTLGCVACGAARDVNLQGARRIALQAEAPAPALPVRLPLRLLRTPRPQPHASLTRRFADASLTQRACMQGDTALRVALPLERTSDVAPSGEKLATFTCLVVTDSDDGGADTLRAALGDSRCSTVKIAAGCAPARCCSCLRIATSMIV
jgi:hypothetical protein